METVNNVINAASRAIWGDPELDGSSANEPTLEPVSGQTGNTAKGEPYDLGNSGIDANMMATSNTNNERTSTPVVSRRDSKQNDRSDNSPAMEPIQPEQETEKTGATSTTSTRNPGNAFAPDKPSGSSDASGPGVTSSDPTSGTQNIQNTQKQQGADRPCEEPSGNEGDVIRDSKQEPQNAHKVDTSDLGSKTPAEAHGDAANKASEGGEDNLQKPSLSNGTGEKYVKSTGVSADGGDFDAAKPGAGREADRLLGEKSVQRAGQVRDGSESVDKLVEKANKLSLGEKIKAKLHKN